MRLTVLFIVLGVSGLFFIGALGHQMQTAETAAESNNASATYNQTREVFEVGIGIGSTLWPMLIIAGGVISSFFVLLASSRGGGR